MYCITFVEYYQKLYRRGGCVGGDSNVPLSPNHLGKRC